MIRRSFSRCCLVYNIKRIKEIAIMSFNDDFMDFIGFMTNGTGRLPEEDLVVIEDDDEDEDNED